MPEDKGDIWSKWLLHGRFPGDPSRAESMIAFLYPIRDRVLDNADLSDAATLLDVGCGDGMIAFGALRRNPSVRAIFSDISQPLLDRSRQLAEEAGYLDRCQFLLAPADDLSALPDASVDAVTTRSVLIYVKNKARAFAEFYRVLKPSGRLSLFEPVNHFGYPGPPDRFGPFDITPVRDLADRIKAFYASLQPVDEDPMLDFDERDLFTLAEKAGFRWLHLAYEANVERPRPITWDAWINLPGNPKIPALKDAVPQLLTPDEAGRFMSHLQAEFEAGRGAMREAYAYLWAEK